MFLEIIVNRLNQSVLRYPPALSYLHGRGVTDDDIKQYRVGYTKSIPIIECDTPEYQRFLDETNKGKKFENKVVFPICDSMGQVVGLVGRALDVKIFKVFLMDSAKQGCFFFGLDKALPYIYEKNIAFVVEGAFDYFALKKVLPNTVAALTAKLSLEQYKLLSAYCDRIVTVFDSDVAGFKGSSKTSEFKNVFSMTLGNYKDPSKCLSELKDKFKSYVEGIVARDTPIY